MANKIDILIKAKDEASKEIEGVTDSLEDLEGGAEELEKTGSKSFGDFMDNVAIAMLGINQAIEVGMKIAEAAKRVYEATVGKALDIAKEVETLSRISGDAPENMSALRIAAQEAKVPFEDLYKAMENLNKNGIAPTVGNLVLLAGEYVAIQDPIAQATFLTENFGAAGDDIAPMLEAIAGGVKAVDDAGLIFTEEEIQAANNYETALIELGNAWDNFAVKVGNAVIPSLTEILNNLAGKPTELETLYDELYTAMDKALFKGGINAGTWQLIMEDATTVTGTYSEQVEKLKFHIAILNDMNGDATSSTEGLTKAEIEAMIAAEQAAIAQAQLNAEIEAITTLDANYKGIISLAYDFTDILEDITEQETIMANNPIGSEKYDEAKGKAEELKAKMGELANRVTLDMFQATIAVGGVTEAELAAYMQMAIDMGLMSEKGAQAALEAYGNAIKTINGYELDDKTGNVTIDAVSAFATLDLLQQYSLLDKEQRVFVKTYYGTSGSPDPYENYTGPSYPANGQVVYAAGHAAAGAAASLPYYWVGERGPEPFFPSVDGRIVSNTQAMSALRGGAGANAREIANAVKQGVKEAMRDNGGGKIYSLTMPTSSNPADVRTAFELMEAWA